jgi:hypothetical protein
MDNNQREVQSSPVYEGKRILFWKTIDLSLFF